VTTSDPITGQVRLTNPPAIGQRLRGQLSAATLGLTLIVLAAAFLLLSPPPGQTYPGAIPWSDGSLLKRIVDALSLGGTVATARGVEIKQFVFHLGAAVALLLLAARAVVSAAWPPDRRTSKGAWFAAQVFFGGWVAISAASASWSGDPPTALGQAALYGMALAWAVALSWNIESRDVPRLVWGYVGIAAAASVLCVWYYHERNPHHRPGFPIGNPGALAAAILPAFVIASAWVALAGRDWLRTRQGSNPVRIVIAAVALIPLAWCFALAGSRAALAGALGAVAGMLFLRARAWTKLLVLLGVVLIAALATWYASAYNQDLAMGRGATVRFRVYAWQYAAQLWSHRPVSGIGAGGYPRLASGISVRDRVLDPAAFMGSMVEHAHNELFEVFAEIGLIGGVSFVAAYLATFVAGSSLLGSNLSPQRRRLVFALLAGLMAIVGDSAFSVGPRLPGPDVVLFSLLGAVWALSRGTYKVLRGQPPNPTWLERMPMRRYGVAVAALTLAVGAAWLAARNWSGVIAEQAADVHLRDGEFSAAVADSSRAAALLLDPVRQLVASEFELRARLGLAAELTARALSAGQSGAAQERDDAIRAAQQAYEAAGRLNQRAPAISRLAAYGAQAAEMLAALHRNTGSPAALEWTARAQQAWLSQRLARPYDVDTLLALARYPATIGDRLTLLRDALREGPMSDDWPEWRGLLAQSAGDPQFAAELQSLVTAARPYGPDAGADTIMITMAPEALRLGAAWSATQGDARAALELAGEAAKRYEAVRARLPDRQSIALGEQAEYAFLSSPADPDAAIALVEHALRVLPAIQEQKRQTAEAPFRARLARYLLAAGREPQALRELTALSELAALGPQNATPASAAAQLYVSLAQRFVRTQKEQRPPVDRWLRAATRLDPRLVSAWAWLAWLAGESGDPDAVRAVLAEAQAALSPTDVERIRTSLTQEFPALKDALAVPETAPASSSPSAP
jgi:O-antigen ligase